VRVCDDNDESLIIVCDVVVETKQMIQQTQNGFLSASRTFDRIKITEWRQRAGDAAVCALTHRTRPPSTRLCVARVMNGLRREEGNGPMSKYQKTNQRMKESVTHFEQIDIVHNGVVCVAPGESKIKQRSKENHGSQNDPENAKIAKYTPYVVDSCHAMRCDARPRRH
jgi:hypothetical protein